MIIEEGRLMVIARYLETNYFIKHSGRIQQEILLQSKSGGFVQLFSQPKRQKYQNGPKIRYFLLPHVLLVDTIQSTVLSDTNIITL